MTRYSDWQDPISGSTSSTSLVLPSEYSDYHGAQTDIAMDSYYIDIDDRFFREYESWMQDCVHTHIAAGSGFSKSLWNPLVYPDRPDYFYTCPTPTPFSRVPSYNTSFGAYAQTVMAGSGIGIFRYMQYTAWGVSIRKTLDINYLNNTLVAESLSSALTIAGGDPDFMGSEMYIEFEDTDPDSGSPQITYSNENVDVSITDFTGSWTAKINANITGYNFDAAGYWASDYWGPGSSVANATGNGTVSFAPDFNAVYSGGGYYSLFLRHTNPSSLSIAPSDYGNEDRVIQTAKFAGAEYSTDYTTSRWRYVLNNTPPLRLSQRDDGVRSGIRIKATQSSSSTQEPRAPRIGSGNRYS